MVLPAKLLPAARKSKNISLSNLVIFSTIQILTSPIINIIHMLNLVFNLEFFVPEYFIGGCISGA